MMRVFRWAPVGAVVFLFATCAITYPLSIVSGHVAVGDGASWVPFISATINYPPESCVGAIGLGLCSVCIAISVIALYTALPRNAPKLSVAALVFGLCSALGLFGVGSFQYANVPAAHDTWVFFVFLGGALFMAMTVAAERRRAAKLGALGRTRLVIAVAFWFSALPMMSTLVLKNKTTTSETIGAVAELTSVVLYTVFCLTFMPVLRSFRFALTAEPVPSSAPLLN